MDSLPGCKFSLASLTRIPSFSDSGETRAASTLDDEKKTEGGRCNCAKCFSLLFSLHNTNGFSLALVSQSLTGALSGSLSRRCAISLPSIPSLTLISSSSPGATAPPAEECAPDHVSSYDGGSEAVCRRLRSGSRREIDRQFRSHFGGKGSLLREIEQRITRGKEEGRHY